MRRRRAPVRLRPFKPLATEHATVLKRLVLAAALATSSPTEAQAPAASPAMAAEAVETIRERDAAGRVRVEREVRQNEAGDFVNHGVWRAWDASGGLAGQGRYAWGEPTGKWSRWAPEDEAEIVNEEGLLGFEAPYLSQATYRDGLLEGRWSVFDAQGRRLAEVEFRAGRRHGMATLWSADGEVLRRGRYEEGLAIGEHQERAADGSLVVARRYELGRSRSERLEHHAGGGLQRREGWLGPVERAATADDPWRVRLARYEPRGEAVRDGLREAWWPNGQPKLRAEYRLGAAIGEACWWHENGQLALRGGYEEGLAAGDWTWWRENGVRAASCRYSAGQVAGEWSLWDTSGVRLSPGAGERFARRPDAGLVR